VVVVAGSGVWISTAVALLGFMLGPCVSAVVSLCLFVGCSVVLLALALEVVAGFVAVPVVFLLFFPLPLGSGGSSLMISAFLRLARLSILSYWAFSRRRSLPASSSSSLYLHSSSSTWSRWRSKIAARFL
jgi:hypothetical protein